MLIFTLAATMTLAMLTATIYGLRQEAASAKVRSRGTRDARR